MTPPKMAVPTTAKIMVVCEVPAGLNSMASSKLVFAALVFEKAIGSFVEASRRPTPCCNLGCRERLAARAAETAEQEIRSMLSK